MSDDQESIFQLLRVLIQHRSSGKVIGGLLALVVVVTTCITLFTWNVVVIHYVDELNFARKNTPVLARAVTEVRDSLTKQGEFYFPPLPLIY